jgi:hypothetical protein
VALLVARSAERGAPPTTVLILGPSGRQELVLGRPGDAVTARIQTDAATLIRLCAGRSPDRDRFTLAGSTPADYLLFA